MDDRAADLEVEVKEDGFGKGLVGSEDGVEGTGYAELALCPFRSGTARGRETYDTVSCVIGR